MKVSRHFFQGDNREILILHIKLALTVKLKKQEFIRRKSVFGITFTQPTSSSGLVDFLY